MSKTYRKYLYAGVAAAALLGAAPSAWAQVDVNQTSTNSADVTINPSTISIGGSVAAGAGASIGATGAAAATSVTGINTDFTIPAGGFGTITQAVTNTANVTNTGGTITSTATGATRNSRRNARSHRRCFFGSRSRASVHLTQEVFPLFNDMDYFTADSGQIDT